MSGRKITELPALPIISGDELIVVVDPLDITDSPAGSSKRLTVSQVSGASTKKFRYWRLINARANANTANTDPTGEFTVALDEIDLMELDQSGDYVAVQTLSTLTGTSQDVGNPPSILANGEVNPIAAACLWDATTVSNPAFFLMWDFGADPRAIVSIRQYAALGTIATDSGSFKCFEIEASDDAITWQRKFYVGSFLEVLGGNEWSEFYFLANIDLLSALPSNGSSGKVLTRTGTTNKDLVWQTPSGGSEWSRILTKKISSFSASAGEFYYCDCDAAEEDITITLPSSPSVGDRVGYVKTSFSFNYQVIIDGGTKVVADIMTSGATTTNVGLDFGSFYQGFSMIFLGNEWVFYDSTMIPVAG